MLSCILKGGTASSGKPKKKCLGQYKNVSSFAVLTKKKVKSICPFSYEMSPLLQFVLKRQRYFLIVL